jgi:basic membrane protein A
MITLAAQSNNVVIASTNVYDQAVRTVATNFPNVYFVLESDPIGWYAKNIVNSTAYPTNVILLGPGALANNYVLGALAAKIVGQDAKLGFIQSLDIPVTTHTGATFRLGAESVYSDIEVLKDVMGDFVAPVKCRDSIAFMASQGVKAVFIEQDDTSGILECQELGIYAIAMYKDITAQFPDTIIASCVWNWQLGFSDILDSAATGKWNELRASKWYWEMTIGNGGLTIGTYGNMVTEAQRNFADDLTDNVINYGNLLVPYIDAW